MTRLRHRTSTEAAAAFYEAYIRRQNRLREKRRRQRADAVNAARPATVPPPKNRPDGETVPIYLPFETFRLLIEHCDHFGLRPATYIKKMLMMSALSKGGL